MAPSVTRLRQHYQQEGYGRLSQLSAMVQRWYLYIRRVCVVVYHHVYIYIYIYTVPCVEAKVRAWGDIYTHTIRAVLRTCLLYILV